MSLRVEYAKKLIIPSFLKKKVKAQIIATVSLTFFFVEIVSNQTSFYEQREAPY